MNLKSWTFGVLWSSALQAYNEELFQDCRICPKHSFRVVTYCQYAVLDMVAPDL